MQRMAEHWFDYPGIMYLLAGII